MKFNSACYKFRNIRKHLIYTVMIYVMLILSACSNENTDSNRPTVVVTVLPQEAFVKAVAGDLINIVTMVPPGASPESYQPTPRQMTSLSDASLYFTIGMATEQTNILPSATSLNKNLQVINLVDYVDAIYPARFFEASKDPNHTGRDPHMWMSPRRVIVMVNVIKDQLKVIDPINASVYEKNAANYIKELEAIDRELKTVFEEMTTSKFIIMHPSLGYFADDYGLTMVELEQDGKTSSAEHMKYVIDFARTNDIKVIFYQLEFDSQQAKTLADEVDGTTMALEILSLDYINNLKEILRVFKDTLK